MKIKTDFVTNSSSASFSISRTFLTEIQINLILAHIEVGAAYNMIAQDDEVRFYIGMYDEWSIKVDSDSVYGSTTMDNFDMVEFLELIGVNPEVVDYEGQNY